jgi:Ca-activated chloride channel homolog
LRRCASAAASLRGATGVSMAFVAGLAGLSDADAVQAQTRVAIELVLAVDTSLSVDDREYALQMRGIAWAFRRPEIVELIEQREGVAVTLIQWSNEVDPRFAIPWQLLHEPATVLAFADKVERAAREPTRGFTAMGRAIDFAIEQIAGNPWAGRELKVDISADGRNNSGPLPADAWRRANALGIAVNGLPILTDTYNLDTYFREKVITGPGAFVEIAADYDDFARVFLRKLRRELNPAVSRHDRAPDAVLFASRPSPQ